MLRLVALGCLGAAILCAAPGLAVESMGLHQFEDGPLLAASYQFLPGETAYFSCRLAGYKIDKRKEDDQHVKLSWELDVFDPAGVAITPPKSGVIDARVLTEDKNWLPKFLSSFLVPPFAPSGDYRISVKAKDELAGSEVHADLNFRVKGHDVEPSPTLVTRNLLFLRSEDDKFGMKEAVYHPGSMLWARFDVTGYKYGEKNLFSVDYGLAVESADGKQLFAQPSAAAESDSTFYPQPYVPGMISLSLDKNVTPSSYVLVLTVHDKVGGQTWVARAPFRVE